MSVHVKHGVVADANFTYIYIYVYSHTHEYIDEYMIMIDYVYT